MIRLDKKKHGWRAQAVCARVANFMESHPAEQKEVCQSCPVAGECLEFALDTEVATSIPADGWPVYGGLSGDERQIIIKARVARAKQSKAEAA